VATAAACRPQFGCRRPVGVNRVGLTISPSLPLYPQEPTSLTCLATSEKCQHRKWAISFNHRIAPRAISALQGVPCRRFVG
jgi:hypothetical protein